MSKYIKPDCELGYVEDSAEINYLKFNNIRHTVLGCMLGDFNEEGEYVVDPEIVKELISMPKYIVETLDNIEVCVSGLKLDKQISFLVTFEEDKATLSLIEKLNYEANFKLNSGTYSNINEYILDQVQTSGEINRNTLYAKWNISQYPGNVIDIFSCDESVLEKYFGIVNRFKYLLAANKILLDKEQELEEIEAEYAVEMLNILKHYPKLEKLVIKELVETLNEKKDFITPQKPNFAKTVNELLDKVIEENKKELSETNLKEFVSEQRNAKVNLNVKRQDLVQTEEIKENENSTTIFRTPEISNPLSEIAQAYLKSHKAVEVVYKKRATDNQQTTNANRLVATLIGAGVGFATAGVGGAIAGAVAANVVADTAKKLETTPQVNSNSNKTTKPATKGNTNKSTAGNNQKKKVSNERATTTKTNGQSTAPQTSANLVGRAGSVSRRNRHSSGVVSPKNNDMINNVLNFSSNTDVNVTARNRSTLISAASTTSVGVIATSQTQVGSNSNGQQIGRKTTTVVVEHHSEELSINL